MSFSALSSLAVSNLLPLDSYEDAAAGGLVIFTILIYVLAFALSIVVVIAQWKIFTKAREAGWWSLIPYANNYMLFKIVYGNGWKFLLLLVPGLNCVLPFFLCYRLAQVFGKGGGFAVGLMFLPVVFLPMLAFDSSRYRRPMNNVFM